MQLSDIFSPGLPVFLVQKEAALFPNVTRLHVPCVSTWDSSNIPPFDCLVLPLWIGLDMPMYWILEAATRSRLSSFLWCMTSQGAVCGIAYACMPTLLRPSLTIAPSPLPLLHWAIIQSEVGIRTCAGIRASHFIMIFCRAFLCKDHNCDLTSSHAAAPFRSLSLSQ